MAFGHIATPNNLYVDRPSLAASGLHRNIRGGIAGSAIPGQGAESIVLADGYEDDDDQGAFVLYTGHGGRDEQTKKQKEPQNFTHLNKTLLQNVSSGQPVRLIRKTPAGFRYDGLYSVDDAYDVLGKSGYRICRYELTQLTSTGPSRTPRRVRGGRARRVEFTGSRNIRDTARSMAVKTLYDYCCQVCGVRLETKKGGYAEGAHIIPISKPYFGPDDESNILCLCPNHHALLDKGGIYVTDTHDVHDRTGAHLGSLTATANHDLDIASLQHHRTRFGF